MSERIEAESVARRGLIASGRSAQVVAQSLVGRLDPEDAFETAVAEWNAGRAEDAAATLAGDDARTLHALGWMHFQRGSDALALTYAERAAELAPTQVRHLALLAAVLLAQRKVTRAEPVAQRLVALAPASAATHALLGRAAAARAAWSAASAALDKAVELDPQAVGLRLLRADIAERQGHIRAAVDDLMRAAESAPALRASHVAPLVDRTLGVGHAAITVAVLWGLPVLAGMANQAAFLAGAPFLVVAGLLLVWHRRRLAQITPEARATYRQARIWTHVIRALLATLAVEVAVQGFITALAPRGADVTMLRSGAAFASTALTIAVIVLLHSWRRVKGIPVEREVLLGL